MKSKKKHTNQDFEVVDGIGKYMDDDIQRIIEGKQLELGDRELPPFDEYRIYKNIQAAVMREEKRKDQYQHQRCGDKRFVPFQYALSAHCGGRLLLFFHSLATSLS